MYDPEYKTSPLAATRDTPWNHHYQTGDGTLPITNTAKESEFQVHGPPKAPPLAGSHTAHVNREIENRRAALVPTFVVAKQPRRQLRGVANPH